MKTVSYIYLICSLVFANSVSASAQNNAANKQAMQMLKEFYRDHDPLITDKYTDAAHLKTLSITKDPAKANEYIVTYIAHAFNGVNSPVSEQAAVHVTVVKEGAGLRISSVR